MGLRVGSRFSHATTRIGDEDLLRIPGGTFAAYARRMHAERPPGAGLGFAAKSASLGGRIWTTNTGATTASKAAQWQLSSRPWWLTGMLPSIPQSPHAASERTVNADMSKPFFFTRSSRERRAASYGPHALYITRESTVAASEVDVCPGPYAGHQRHKNLSRPSAQSTPASLGRVALQGDTGTSHHSLTTDSVASELASADTQYSNFAHSFPSPLLADSEHSSVPASAGLHMHVPHSHHLPQNTDAECGIATRCTQHHQHTQHTQHTQRGEHTQDALQAQNMEDDFISLTIPSQVTETLQWEGMVDSALTESSALALSPQQDTPIASVQQAGEAGGYTTLAPSNDIGLSATDASFTDRHIRVLMQQLDAFAPEDLFLQRFEMLGHEKRRRGGVLWHADRCCAVSGFCAAICVHTCPCDLCCAAHACCDLDVQLPCKIRMPKSMPAQTCH